MKYLIILLPLICGSFRGSIPTVYTASSEVIIVSTTSCNTEEDLIHITMLINSESGNQSLDGKEENFKNLNARRLDIRYPNTFKGVIYQPKQYNGVDTDQFKFKPELYELVKQWHKENEIGYVCYFNPKLATNEKFIKWSNQFTKHVVDDHVYFGNPELK